MPSAKLKADYQALNPLPSCHGATARQRGARCAKLGTFGDKDGLH